MIDIIHCMNIALVLYALYPTVNGHGACDIRVVKSSQRPF